MSYNVGSTGFSPRFSRGTVTMLDNIDDNTIAEDTTWSSEKISSENAAVIERVEAVEADMENVNEVAERAEAAAEEAHEAAQTVEDKVETPEVAGGPGQVLALDSEGNTVWVDVPTQAATTAE